VWAIIFGYWLFDEVPDSWVIIGSLGIVAAISYLTHREAVAARRLKMQAAESSSLG
jgi:drug/metabolite transporter (DMT)-like permease